jgi:hypothetical protein
MNTENLTKLYQCIGFQQLMNFMMYWQKINNQ